MTPDNSGANEKCSALYQRSVRGETWRELASPPYYGGNYDDSRYDRRAPSFRVDRQLGRREHPGVQATPLPCRQISERRHPTMARAGLDRLIVEKPFGHNRIGVDGTRR